MVSKLKEMFKQKDKKQENLIFLLVVLIIMLIAINCILKDDEQSTGKKYADAELVSTSATTEGTTLETRIESILSEIDGVRKSISFTYICR